MITPVRVQLASLAAVFSVVSVVHCGASTTTLGSIASTDGGTSGDSSALLPDSAASGDAAVGATCNILSDPKDDILCVAGSYCVFEGNCRGPGICTTIPGPPPPACPSLECGCDSVVRCLGHSAPLGIAVSPTGSCVIPCGTTACDGLTQFCQFGTGGAMAPDGGAAKTYMCQSYPTACETNHSCACLATASGSAAISCDDKDGKVTREIPLP